MTKHHQQVTSVYEESREDVYRYLLTLGLPPPQAQEAAQEAFLRLYITLERGEVVRNLRAWVFRVAHNHAMDVLANERLKPLDREMESMFRDRRPGAESDLIEREKMELVGKAWVTLSRQQKQCLHLRAEGLRYREIAEALEISISSVREFVGRAISRLQKAVYE
jgi:RNA polymerase sigma-70 factor (ECF subfamily)